MNHHHSRWLAAFAGVALLLISGCGTEDTSSIGSEGGATDLQDDSTVMVDSARNRGVQGSDLKVSEVVPDTFLERGQVKVLNLCESLSLYLYNPAYHGTGGNPREVVGYGKKLIWQTLSGTPSGWATVLSAGQEYWGWRFARVECLGNSWLTSEVSESDRLTLGAAPAADARSATRNGTYQICAPGGLYLRNAPSGPAIDRLRDGTHFEVTSSAGGNWVYGYSYWAEKSGWVQNGHFC